VEDVGPSWLELPAAILAFWCVVRGVFWLLDDSRPRDALADRLRERFRAPRPLPVPPRRPIEVVAAEARLLALRVHHPPRGVSFAKYQGWVSAYDRLLGEGCAALEVEHLLDVLEPGEERDLERSRVESLLWLAGLRIDEVA
jgi:hypothetical protein